MALLSGTRFPPWLAGWAIAAGVAYSGFAAGLTGVVA
jgi:hypothetical protein